MICIRSTCRGHQKRNWFTFVHDSNIHKFNPSFSRWPSTSVIVILFALTRGKDHHRLRTKKIINGKKNFHPWEQGARKVKIFIQAKISNYNMLSDLITTKLTYSHRFAWQFPYWASKIKSANDIHVIIKYNINLAINCQI